MNKLQQHPRPKSSADSVTVSVMDGALKRRQFVTSFGVEVLMSSFMMNAMRRNGVHC